MLRSMQAIQMLMKWWSVVVSELPMYQLETTKWNMLNCVDI